MTVKNIQRRLKFHDDREYPKIVTVDYIADCWAAVLRSWYCYKVYIVYGRGSIPCRLWETAHTGHQTVWRTSGSDSWWNHKQRVGVQISVIIALVERVFFFFFFKERRTINMDLWMKMICFLLQRVWRPNTQSCVPYWSRRKTGCPCVQWHKRSSQVCGEST